MRTRRTRLSLRLPLCGLLACFGVAPAAAQVTPERLLEIDGYTVDEYRAAATLAQDVQPLVNQRGTGLDGSLRLQAPFGWVVNANPFHEEWNDNAWYLGQIMLNTGRYSPTEIDMALPAPGFRWTVGRTYNIPGDPNSSGTLRTEGYQGYNWQQFSQPELVYVTGPEDEDYIYIVYGADRYLTFRQLEENSPVFRGVNGAAGAVVAGSSGDHELFVYWDQRGTRSTFFDPRDNDNQVTVSSELHDGTGQLWTIEDAAGNKAFVGHATDPTDAIEAGYDESARIQLAFDTSGRKYEYLYESIVEDSPGTRSESRLTRVEAFVSDGSSGWDSAGATVEYTYSTAVAGSSSYYSFGDLVNVAITRPLSGFDSEWPSQSVSTINSQYLYHSTTSGTAEGRPHWIRFAISPEGVRQHIAQESSSPLDSPSTAIGYSDFGFEYYTEDSGSLPAHSGKIRTIQYAGSEFDDDFPGRTELFYGSYNSFTSSSTPTYDPGHSSFVTIYPQIEVGRVVFAQYFDEAGQPVTHVENMAIDATNGFLQAFGLDAVPAYSSDLPAKWTYVSRRATDGTDGVDGMISMIASPLSVESADFNPPYGSGYEPPCEIKVATSGTNGQLVHVFPRVTSPSDPFWGFLTAKSWQNGYDTSMGDPEDGPFPIEEFEYLAPEENVAAATTVASAYLVIRPFLSEYRSVSAVDFTTATTTADETTFGYEFHAKPVGGVGSSTADDPAWLAPRRITTTLPAVSTSLFGSGTSATLIEYYREDGTMSYAKDEVGSHTYLRYENGLAVREIEDADLAQTSDFATGDQPGDYMASVPSTTAAFHLITDLSRDEIGRITAMTLPTGRNRQAYYTELASGELVNVWSARSDSGTHDGPADFHAWDHNGNLIVDASIAFSGTGSTTAGLDSWIDVASTHSLDALDEGEWGEIQTHVFSPSGRVLWADRKYFSTPLSGDGARSYNYDERLFQYGAELRPTGVAEMNGTLRSLNLDPYGLSESVSVGSYDPREGVPPPMGGGIALTLPVWAVCCDEVTSFYGIPFTEACTTESGRGTPGARYVQGSIRGQVAFELELEAPHTFREYDNLGRIIREAVYTSVPDSLTLRSPLPVAADRDDPNIFTNFDDRFDTPRSLVDGRRSLVEYQYNPRGKIARVRQYEIDQTGEFTSGETLTDGSGEKYVETIYAYDAANRLIYVNNGRVTKIKRDRLGREITRYEIANHNDTLTSYSALTNPTGDIVVRQTQMVYESDSNNLTHEIMVDRITNIDPFGSEPFGAIDDNDYSDPSSFSVDPAELFGRVQITEYTYDALDRVASRKVHGTGNTHTGSTFSSTAPPAGALTTTLTRDAAGRITEVEDELGRIQSRSYDLAGKLTETIDNFDSGTTGSVTDDINRRTGYEYLHTNLVSYKAYTDPTDPDLYQETQYEWYSGYDSTSYDVSRDRVYQITYPDSKTEQFLYHVKGPLWEFKDRSANHVKIELDDRYRPIEFVVLDIPSGNNFDQAEGDRIELGYNERGMLGRVAQSRSNGSWVHDEVLLSYNGYGALASISQSQNWLDEELGLTGVGGAAPSFGYTWQRSAAAAPSHLRLASNAYPDTKVLTYNYSGTSNNALSRVTNMNFDGTTVAVYDYLGVDRPALTTYPENNVFSTLRDSSGNYDALDRFNRPVRSRWNRARASNQVPFYDTTVHWDDGSNVTGVTDHVFDTDFNFVYANDQLNRLVGSTRGGGTGATITSMIEQEDWTLTKVGNWAAHDLELTGDSPADYTDPGEFQAGGGFSDINETTLIERDVDDNGVDPAEEFIRVYDSNGNLISDEENGHHYEWDLFGRLTRIRTDDDSDPSDDLVAEFRYNALGHRIAERIEADGEDWTRLVYDARWRIVATYRIDVSEDEEALGERLVYHAAGLDGVGTGSYIDALVLRDRDADANGSLEERHYYAQSWRHDVVAVIDHLGRQIEHMRYTPYGVPISIPASDGNRDGVLDQDDLDDLVAAISGGYEVRYDMDLDGDVDVFDLYIASGQHGAIGSAPIGRGVLSAFGHRAGFAGYQWVPAAGLYHVRHRWYDPLNGTWLSKDPAGYVDGASLFGYVANHPLQVVDPFGLSPRYEDPTVTMIKIIEILFVRNKIERREKHNRDNSPKVISTHDDTRYMRMNSAANANCWKQVNIFLGEGPYCVVSCHGSSDGLGPYVDTPEGRKYWVDFAPTDEQKKRIQEKHGESGICIVACNKDSDGTVYQEIANNLGVPVSRAGRQVWGFYTIDPYINPPEEWYYPEE